MTIPHLFRCPISLDLFKDPVTLCTGQTYDRSSIEQWLASGNLTCPVTMQQLRDLTVVPNHTLRDLIQRWLQIPDQHSLVTVESLQELKQRLETEETVFETKLQTLQTLRVLSEESSSVPCLIRLGFLPLLFKLVFGRFEEEEEARLVLSEDNTKLVEHALFCVVKLFSFSEIEYLNILEEEFRLGSFLSLFKHGSSAIKTSLCRLISIASSSSKTKELCSTLGNTRQLLHEMAIFIHHSSEASDPGIEALWKLSSSARNQEYFIREGVLEGLISYVSSSRERVSLAPMALALLEKLLDLESAKEALLSNPIGMSTLVKRVFKVSDNEGSESAVGSLTRVCCGSLQAREAAIEAGVLTQLLLLLQSQCSGRTKTKVRLLLKLLRSKWIQ